MIDGIVEGLVDAAHTFSINIFRGIGWLFFKIITFGMYPSQSQFRYREETFNIHRFIASTIGFAISVAYAYHLFKKYGNLFDNFF
ncbi:MAG: hypothetical protein HUN04_22385 [Desulfobacter sp.]|nr:MAG: hypothetical protein HUN04_22385 [Desulfobacter sp.]